MQLHVDMTILPDRSAVCAISSLQDYTAELYNRKQLHYTEGIIFPALRFEDFNADLFPRIRNLIRSNNTRHPWLELDDRQILVKAGLFRRDLRTGKEGYVLAAALLLGTDEAIQQVVPHYKIDALVRKIHMDRYDDREYTNALPATFCIYRDRVEVENANNPHGEGQLSLDDFTPYPKNPLISKFFMQMGRVEELGSGFLNVHKYLGYYSPKKKPQFIEGVRFRTIIPLDETLMAE